FHIMGTVLMGNDPKTSVVDKDLRSHDHDNLFLCTTGVMPSSATVNPTLTGVALSIRAAHTIAKEV
ncbi:GMC family oxidoreductase, partial [Thioclava sp. BHET1]